MAAVALSATICYLATQVAAALSAPSQSITIITGITVALATLFPQQLGRLAAAGEGLAALLMQVSWAADSIHNCVLIYGSGLLNDVLLGA
jgi:hypothetical protein